MTIGLQITDGTTTLDLNDGTYFEIEELDPGFGPISSETVSGSVKLYMDGTKAQIQTELASLQKLLQQVLDYSGESLGGALVTAADNPVYLNYRTDAGEAYYRSELRSASLTIEQDNYRILNYDCGAIDITVDFVRANWWEGAEAQIAISTRSETDVTTAATVYNPCPTVAANTIAFVSATKKITDTGNGLARFQTGDTIVVWSSASNDGTYTVATGGVAGEIVTVEALVDEPAGSGFVNIFGPTANYIDLGSGDVAGDMPAASRLEMTNNYNISQGLRFFWIGQNFTNPTTHQHIYEAEDATGTSDTSGQDSNGEYVRIAVNSASETEVFLWPMSVANLNAAAGRWFKVIAHFHTVTNVKEFRFRFQLEVNNVIFWKGPLTLPDQNYTIFNRDLLTFQLPPALAGMSGFGACDLVMSAYQETGSAQNLDLDFIQITPVDGFRYLECIAGECEYGRRVIDDGIDKYLYEDDGAGAVKRPSFVGVGTPLMLQPGKAQRLIFLFETNSLAQNPLPNTIGVKLYYRPRRLTI